MQATDSRFTLPRLEPFRRGVAGPPMLRISDLCRTPERSSAPPTFFRATEAARPKRAMHTRVIHAAVAALATAYFSHFQQEWDPETTIYLSLGVFASSLIGEAVRAYTSSFDSSSRTWLDMDLDRFKSLFEDPTYAYVAFLGSMLARCFVSELIEGVTAEGLSVTEIVCQSTLIPVVEEILFRGFLQERFEEINLLAITAVRPHMDASRALTTAETTAAVTQSLLFGAGHRQYDYFTQLFLSIQFLYNTYINKRVASLLPGIFAHALRNSACHLGKSVGYGLRSLVSIFTKV